MNKRRSFITGIKSTTLTSREKFFLKKFKPWGVILFSRNIKSINQTRKLTNSIKKIFNDKNYPIITDQEGGRVNRFGKIFKSSDLTSEYFGKLYLKNKKKFNFYYKKFINQTSKILKSTGININTVPVLDLRVKGANSVIGDRSFSSNPKVVSKIGDICIETFHKKKICTIIKHIPGHGLAKVDSHKSTPTVNNKYNQLIKNDFFTFKNKKSLMAMTAHIIYKDLDTVNTATHSKKVIKKIRKDIKFKHILISDDISMKSLKYSTKINTLKAFSAGCDLVLHCNGKYKEMLIVAENSTLLSNFMIKKTSQIYKILS
jgi:beta-N-acetylhexosaminidase